MRDIEQYLVIQAVNVHCESISDQNRLDDGSMLWKYFNYVFQNISKEIYWIYSGRFRILFLPLKTITTIWGVTHFMESSVSRTMYLETSLKKTVC